MRIPALPLLLLPLALLAAPAVHARTVYRCVQHGTTSLATAPELEVAGPVFEVG